LNFNFAFLFFRSFFNIYIFQWIWGSNQHRFCLFHALFFFFNFFWLVLDFSFFLINLNVIRLNHHKIKKVIEIFFKIFIFLLLFWHVTILIKYIQMKIWIWHSIDISYDIFLRSDKIFQFFLANPKNVQKFLFLIIFIELDPIRLKNDFYNFILIFGCHL
jgi:hypothetical protein